MKDIIKKNPVTNATFGTDPSNPWATKYNVTEATETELLARYLNSRGVNPRFVTRDTKIAHAKSSEYAKWKADHIERFAREEVEVKEDHVAIAMGKQLDDEGSMILNQLDQIARSVEMLRPVIKKPDMQVPAWVQSKVTLATDYIDTVANYMTSNNEKVNEAKKPTALEKFRKASAEREKKHAEIEKKQSKDGSGMTAAIDRLEKQVNKEEVEQVNEMNKSQKPPTRHGDYRIGTKGTVVKPVTPKKIVKDLSKLLNKSFNKEEAEQIDEKNVPTSPEKWARAKAAAKSKFAVYPSAYANGWASKKYKAMGGGWKSVKEEIEQLDEVSSSEVEQIDELKKSTVFSWLKKQPVVPEKKPGMTRKDFNKKIKTSSKSWNRALDRLAGYKPTSEAAGKDELKMKEDAFQDTQAATQMPFDGANTTNDTDMKRREASKSARIIKSIYKRKNMKEELNDWEKEDKSVQSYGKKPKLDMTDKKDNVGENKPEARAVMAGGKTLTGQPRDMVEIDPSMKNRPDRPDTCDKGNPKKSPA